MEGTIYRNRPIRVLRDGIVVFQGELESLRRHKDDVNDVRAGIECGLAVKGYNDIKDFVGSLKSPRRIMIMVKAGAPVQPGTVLGTVAAPHTSGLASAPHVHFEVRQGDYDSKRRDYGIAVDPLRLLPPLRA